ncbi:MAG: LPXTG cell wall anchor domain-containing protein [Clostridia bacterium]|jgi:hypothetical protein|nr:LPXTG cell wall anchor domain-containing protein [Clostridia bacterium]
MPGFTSFEPVNCGPDPCPPPGGKPQTNSDTLLMGLLGLAVALFALYFVVKSGVKNALLETAEELKLPLPGSSCR